MDEYKTRHSAVLSTYPSTAENVKASPFELDNPRLKQEIESSLEFEKFFESIFKKTYPSSACERTALSDYFLEIFEETKHPDYLLFYINEQQQYLEDYHNFWWKTLSTVAKLRNHPREFLSFGTLSIFCFTFYCLISGLILDRIIIAPDYGVLFLILSFIFWLMTQVKENK